MTGPDDTLTLLQRWNGGDSDALRALIERHLEWMRDYVRRRLGDRLRARGDTQDFVQEAMVDVLRYGPRFEVADEDCFRGLLARIVENNLRDEARRVERAGRHGLDGAGLRASDTVLRLDPAARSVTRPSERIDRDEQVAWVRLALEMLTPEDRQVVWLREYEGCSFAKVAERFGVTEDAARMRFCRALPRLAQKVRELRSGQLPRLSRDEV